MQLIPDSSFFAQIVTFVVLWLGLKRLIFEPMRKLLDLREQQTVTAQVQAAALVTAAEASRADYERTIHDLRVDSARAAAAARAAAHAQHTRTLAEARAVAAQELEALRAALREQTDAARETLRAQAERLADDMLQRVTGSLRS